MRSQRKIHHLLESNGTGRDFRYLEMMNPKHHFNWDDPIIVTDKIDGTTVQADNQIICQRRDNFKKGDPRKFTASEEERYHLEKLEESSQNKWIFEAVEPFREQFLRLSAGVAVYFECFGPKIGTRYRNMENHSIRVFDVAFKGQFSPFTETIILCEMFDLPLVGYKLVQYHGIQDIIKWLQDARHADLKLYEFELEGWVIRQREEIAKIRKSDLEKLLVKVDKTK